MKYMGSKRRIAKYILPIINSYLSGVSTYFEPFVGGFNMMENVYLSNGRMIASDYNKYLICLYRSLKLGWLPPEVISEELYDDIKLNKDSYPDELVGYVGFSLSFGGKWFGGYRRDKKGDNSRENELVQSRRAFNEIMRQVSTPAFQKTWFFWDDYSNTLIPNNSLVYCDPPYANTTKYTNPFDSNAFWGWVRATSAHSVVLVSEYSAPDDFDCVWSMPLANTLNTEGSKQSVEKLFKYKG